MLWNNPSNPLLLQKDGTIITSNTGWITFPFYFVPNFMFSPPPFPLTPNKPTFIKAQPKVTIFKQITGHHTTVVLSSTKTKSCRVHDDCLWTQLCNMNQCINVTSLRPCSGENPCPSGWMCSRYDFCLSTISQPQSVSMLNFKQQEQQFTQQQYIPKSGGIERSVQKLLGHKRQSIDGCTSNYDCRYAGPKNQKCNSLTGKCVWCLSYSDCGVYHERCNLFTNMCGK
uniref:Chitin-binding type-1 domain-containing protein n=1 Tax=Syphacia muris TaxID=451379 RepID=A0A0N5AXB2_9BILA